MKITDMILVTENWKGAEINSLMDIRDYLELIDKDSWLSRKELAENMVELGKTLKDKDGWAEIYFAANKTVSARYCADEEQLGSFLRGNYNSMEQEWRFDEQHCSEVCLEQLKAIGMDKKGWITGAGLHYEKREAQFRQGQILHNFNNRDYRVLECLSDKNLLVMDVKSGAFTVALGVNLYARCPKGAEPTKQNSRIGIEWDHGHYLSAKPSEIDFRRLKQEYGTPEPIKNLHDYRSYLRSQFYMFHILSQDELATDSIKSAAVNAMYEEFGTGKTDTFEENLEDGKYDAGYTHEKKQKKERAI